MPILIDFDLTSYLRVVIKKMSTEYQHDDAVHPVPDEMIHWPDWFSVMLRDPRVERLRWMMYNGCIHPLNDGALYQPL